MFNGIGNAEKKILRVMKWLERCSQACRAGSSESALMDIECARVELDCARDEIWDVNGKKYVPQKKYRACRVALTVALFLFFAAAPIHIADRIEWVTPDEKILLANLRSRFANENLAKKPIQIQQTQKVQPQTELRPYIVKETKIDEIKLFSLIKTGERALRNEEIVVKVE